MRASPDLNSALKGACDDLEMRSGPVPACRRGEGPKPRRRGASVRAGPGPRCEDPRLSGDVRHRLLAHAPSGPGGMGRPGGAGARWPLDPPPSAAIRPDRHGHRRRARRARGGAFLQHLRRGSAGRHLASAPQAARLREPAHLERRQLHRVRHPAGGPGRRADLLRQQHRRECPRDRPARLRHPYGPAPDRRAPRRAARTA